MNKKIEVTIIGLGQIGASLGLALKKRAAKRYNVTGVARRKEVLKTALKIGAVDIASLSFDIAKTADIIVVCTPVDTISEIYKKLLSIVKANAIITDVGSIKTFARKEIPKSKTAAFVGGHPMAGKENNGIQSADANMFAGAKFIMTGNNAKTVENKVANMWKSAGAKIIKMDASAHDGLVALTSHLPHVIAFSLNKVYKDVKKKNKNIDLLAAGSFKSATRVANSSANMWAPVLSANNKNVIKHLDAFIKELNAFKKILKNKNKTKRKILQTQK
ncbi:prephenate dehydrogenase [Endomicrobium proavitum]|uniref:Prephenate dehydrogenase n=1 Tax=Endomicrobium proavitum TaxID=1408281 RepID=A0A0G3WLA7_9BACT|nr:prephenate dehydrogenase/arogenate dehydrogenase family protein [Endomicrobium proavitum]AKL98652.1 Prephenate dehydrogenase [Endomicrobium proavitum]